MSAESMRGVEEQYKLKEPSIDPESGHQMGQTTFSTIWSC